MYNKKACVDSARHLLQLHSDGFYICSKCGCRVKSPELEDNEILSLADYLMVVSAEMLYVYYELALKSHQIDNISTVQERIQYLINSIRQKSKYINKYSYFDCLSKCYVTDIEKYFTEIKIQSVNFKTVLEFSDDYALFNDLVLGYYAPKIPLPKNISNKIHHQMNALSFSAMIAKFFELDNISNSLTIANNIIELSKFTNICIGDYLVKINVGPYHANFLYNENGEFKTAQIIE